MNELEDVVEVSPINLDDPVSESPLKPLPFPENAVKNRAAITSLLSDEPERMAETYQAIIGENQAGQDYTRSSIMKRRNDEEGPKDIGTIMSILADPSIPYEQKQQAIANINSGWHKDTSVLLASKALEQPSKGEDVEQEDVRLMGADQFKPIFDYNREKQSVMNKHKLSSESSTASTVVDFLSLLQPFSVNKYGVSTLKPIIEELKGKISTGKAAILPGEAMAQIKDAMDRMPPSEKIKVVDKLSTIIQNNSSLFLNSDNNFAELTQMQQVLEGDYSTFDRVLDNVSGVLDAIGLGATIKGAKRLTTIFKRIPALEEAKVLQTAVTESTSPVSPINILKDTNPEKARNAYSLIIKSESDEVAQAIAGTDRASAIIDQKVSQAAKGDGSVAVKLIDPDRPTRVITPDQDIIKEYENTSDIIFSADEIAQAKAHIVNDLRNINGIVLHDNMLGVVARGDGKFQINAMLGTTEGGFKKASEAFNHALYALREYGVGAENLQLMKKVDGEYVPITLAETKGRFGNYMVKVEVSKPMSMNEVLNPMPLDVKHNWFDRIPAFISQKSGSIARHLLDAASMLHPQLTKAATVLEHKSVLLDKKLVELFHDFAQKHEALDSVRQGKVYDYLKEANLLGVEHDEVTLLGKGFKKEEVEAIKAWRKGWDTHFWFENADVAKTLRNQDYKIFENTNDRFFVKQSAKNSTITDVYDPALQQVRRISQKELDDLYANGGYYGKLRRPTDMGGTTVEHIIVRNTPSEYARAIRDNDQILNYRPGYYQVHYKAPKFIVRVVRDGSGNELYTKAIGVAGDSGEAEHLRQRTITSQGLKDEDVYVRADLNEMKVDTDHYWDLQNSSGRVAQKHRGKRLEEATNPITSFDSQYVVDPTESAIRSSRSLATRVSMRDYIESAKARAVKQYEEFFPRDKFNQPMWVEDAASLVAKRGTLYDKKISDARTTVENINYIQYGYANSMDEKIKGLFNTLASQAADMGAYKVERGLLAAGQVGPTQLLKSGVFTSYLALNPLRQFIIQSHQATRLAGYNPMYLLSGKWPSDTMVFGRYKMGERGFSKAQQEMIDFVEESGVLQGVDRQNLVRGTLTDLVEAHNPVKRIVGKAIAIPRRMGFDLGEQTNRLHHLLSVRDKFIREGKDLTNKTVRDEAYAYADALSYSMNHAGDMPYNQNSMGVFLQFMQVPHKAITSVTTNRIIKPQDKLRLILTDSLLWGVPGATVLSNLVGQDMLPEDSVAREAVVFGLESAAFNNSLMKVVGKNPHIDFSGFSPYNTEGFAHLFDAIATGGYSEYITNSPSFSLYFKEGSRMREALGRLGRYTGFIDTQQGLEVPDALAVLNSFAEAGSSGWSNYNKAKAIYETGKIKTSKGSTLNEDANYVQAAAQLFGFKTQDEIIDYAVMNAFKEGTKEHKDSVLQVYNTYIKLLSKEQKMTNDNPEWVVTILGAMKNMYKDDPKAMEIIYSQLKKDLYNNDMRITKNAFEYAKLPTSSYEGTINNMKILNDDERNKALQMMKDLQQQAKEYGEDN